jgi:sirohydrochlorin ferrochelatase
MPALALLAQSAATVDQPVPDEAEIVVIGQRLERISVSIGRDAKGRYTCGLSESSGNARIDAQLCKTSANCVRKGASTGDAVAACLTKRKAGLFDAFKREMAKRRS